MLRSLHHNDINWNCSFLGESALLLEPKAGNDSLEYIHRLCRKLEAGSFAGIRDVVPAYRSLAILFDPDHLGHDQLIRMIEEMNSEIDTQTEIQCHEVPVCYDLGLDWKEVESATGLDKGQIIDKHVSKEYTIAMLGFIPGFIFLEGLDTELSCPRRSSPRKKIPAGSVGIGGNQTGLYSLESPGGWNIIGRTPDSFFDAGRYPPSHLAPGDKLTFVPITEAEFDERISGHG